MCAAPCIVVELVNMLDHSLDLHSQCIWCNVQVHTTLMQTYIYLELQLAMSVCDVEFCVFDECLACPCMLSADPTSCSTDRICCKQWHDRAGRGAGSTNTHRTTSCEWAECLGEQVVCCGNVLLLALHHLLCLHWHGRGYAPTTLWYPSTYGRTLSYTELYCTVALAGDNSQLGTSTAQSTGVSECGQVTSPEVCEPVGAHYCTNTRLLAGVCPFHCAASGSLSSSAYPPTDSVKKY